jgi:hypothetical protein
VVAVDNLENDQLMLVVSTMHDSGDIAVLECPESVSVKLRSGDLVYAYQHGDPVGRRTTEFPSEEDAGYKTLRGGHEVRKAFLWTWL